MRCIAILFLLAVNSCDAQTFTRTQVVSNVHYGIAFDFAPDGRIFLTQKGGFGGPAEHAIIKVHAANGAFISNFYDLSDSIDAAGEFGLLGITLDPNFSSNHFVYVFYTMPDPNNSSLDQIRIERFTEVNNTGIQPTVIFSLGISNANHYHVGGNIHFRPSDSTHLYISIGDLGTGYVDDTPARIDNPLGKILRVSKYPGGPIPSDNPFYDDGNPYTGNCDWIWAYGLRNSFDFCFGPNDSLYATENGTSTFDEVNLITKGGFYGWPHCEGSADGDTLSLPCHEPNAISPFTEFPFPLPAVTGIVFYTDTLWNAQQNHLIVGNFNHTDLHQVYLNNAPAYDATDSTVLWIDVQSSNGITGVQQGPEGCIYIMEIGDSVFGGIYKICPFGTGISEHAASGFIRTRPNPFQNTAQVQYSLTQAQQIKIELFDVSGHLVATLLDESQTSGAHSVEIDAQKYALSPGLYTCIMYGEQVNSAIKLVVQE
jgi:glucose/arabinose dehydrogenase